MSSLDGVEDYDWAPVAIAIFDNGVKRPNTTETYPYPYEVEFAESGNILYGSEKTYYSDSW